MSCTRLETSFGSVCASFFLLCATNEMSDFAEHRQINVHATIYGNITERSGTVVLHVRVRGVEQADEDRDSARIDELLPVLIWDVASIRSLADQPDS